MFSLLSRLFLEKRDIFWKSFDELISVLLPINRFDLSENPHALFIGVKRLCSCHYLGSESVTVFGS